MTHNDVAGRRIAIDTEIVTAGRDPHANFGFVNPPVYHASTVLFQSAEKFVNRDQEYVYGRRGTPTMRALEQAVTALENGHTTRIMSSGLGAITTTLLAVLKAGDHILVTDSVYRPVRVFCDGILARFGVETTYYDPLIGAGIAGLMRSNTSLVYTESPGSLTMDVQDMPAIVEAAHAHGAFVVCDNTWATGAFFRPLDIGADFSVQAGTKYLVGHSDAMIGTVTVREELADVLNRAEDGLGQCAGPDDMYLTQRGLRTLSVRLARHMASALDIAQWLEGRKEIARVLYPALPSDPGHDVWKRDFSGASGLFSVMLEPGPREAAYAFLDALTLFGMGASWGGYESLCIPFDPSGYRSACDWTPGALGLRFHIGLEDASDLKADLERGFEAMRKVS